MAKLDPLAIDLYLLLKLVCSKCDAEFNPAASHGWSVPKATEQDVDAMVEKYLPIAIGFGWHADRTGKVCCKACRAM